MRITDHARVRETLAGPGFEVPPVPAADRPGGVRWLRATVARFSTGPEHARRRALAIAALTELDPDSLRRDAATRAADRLAEAAGRPVDVIRVGRVVPAELLTGALGIAATVADAAIAVARAYPPHAEAGPDADLAVDRLVEACGGRADEPTAARIGLLAQAIDATAGLVGNAVLAIGRWRPAASTEAILVETLRHDPPVRVTRRQATTGVHVELDLAAANRDPAVFDGADRFDASRDGADRHLSFGAGPHACPGAPYALAMAAGIVETVRGCRLLPGPVSYEPSPTLRVPAALWVWPR